MHTIRVAALAACHNRRRKTLSALEALFKQKLSPEVSVRVYLVDDGSTDGTADAVRAAYPEVELLRGDGGLFWNGGMSLAFSEALAVGYDYYLWLNDDTLLERDALFNLLGTHRSLAERGSPDSIVVGSTRDAVSGALTYGGLVRTSRWRPLKFRLVEPAEEPRECETMNGNCVLIPHAVAENVGNLSDAFTHLMGDHDYGLRASEMGCSVWVAPGYIGYCPKNLTRESWADKDLSLRERLEKVAQPKGLPIAEWRTFARRYAGPLWFIYWIYPYVRLIGSSVFRRSKRTYRAE
jgi:GT2 family glycosyltransferase